MVLFFLPSFAFEFGLILSISSEASVGGDRMLVQLMISGLFGL
jgi:hypothetical protein